MANPHLRVLALGDLIGAAGRALVQRQLRPLRKQYGVDLVGIDHIGVGSDYSFDHVDFNAELRDNPSAFSDAYTAWGPLQWVPPEDTVGIGDLLAARGYDDDAVAKVLGGNFTRIAAEVWAG